MSTAFYECINNECKFRFPAILGSSKTLKCPVCNNQVVRVHNSFKNIKHNASESPRKDFQELAVVLDNIRSIYNVGAILRTCDGAGVNNIILTGITACPDHPKINKTGLGAEWNITWEYFRNNLIAAENLMNRGFSLCGLETIEGSQSIFNFRLPSKFKKVALVCGNETLGIDPGLIKMCSYMFHIPMIGYKQSLNVAVAFGIAIYQIQFCNS